MLTIAILSTMGLFLGVLITILDHEEKPNGYGFSTAIATISWWDISFPTAIVILCVGSIWMLITIIIRVGERFYYF